MSAILLRTSGLPPRRPPVARTVMELQGIEKPKSATARAVTPA
ncbi:hypothetical protein [Novacetimonas maltaceti]|nr:hypothetical protein [Novacetimonas maltaceti]